MNEAFNERARHIGQSIATVRNYRGMTQKQLAEAIGLTQDRISEIERGQANITMATLFKICDAMKCICDITFTPK
jgi:transcriptional regulator with XRE-family HTH domain